MKQQQIVEQLRYRFMEIMGASVNILDDPLANPNKNKADALIELERASKKPVVGGHKINKVSKRARHTKTNQQ